MQYLFLRYLRFLLFNPKPNADSIGKKSLAHLLA